MTAKEKIFPPLLPQPPPHVSHCFQCKYPQQFDLSYTNLSARVPTLASKQNLTYFLLFFKDPLAGNSRRRRQLHKMQCTPQCSTCQSQGNQSMREGMKLW